MRNSKGACILVKPAVQAIKLTYHSAGDSTCTSLVSSDMVNNTECFSMGTANIRGQVTPLSARINCDFGARF